MKICVIICEFNPFHNGHKYLLEQAKLRSGCDRTVCIMSGSFTQRGEMCILDKYTRARHAVLGGADAVLELPVSFTVAPAEIFAAGAIKIANAIPNASVLAFGCENASADFQEAAEMLSDEDADFKKTLKENLRSGQSYIRSYNAACASSEKIKNALCGPNNILGTEYAKAVLKSRSHLSLLPVERVGGGYNDANLSGAFSSAKAIRQDPENPLVEQNVPSFVFGDLKNNMLDVSAAEKPIRFKLLEADPQKLARIYGCGEGLENRLKNLENLPVEQIITEATAKRYSSSRVRRILLANLLNLFAEDTESFLNTDLYLRPLAVNKLCADEILSALSLSEFPTVMKKRDLPLKNHTAQKCLETDLNAYKIANFIAGRPANDFDYPVFV